MQGDLFELDPMPVAGLGFRDTAITPQFESDLIAGIEQVELPFFPFQGWTSKRRTRSFGWLYDFNNAAFGPTDPIPDFLSPLRSIAAAFAGIDEIGIVQASVIKYEPGAGIGWHKDRPELDAVIGISLGSPATMRFRRRVEEGFLRASLLLPPRSIYHLAGEVRHEWEHSIAPGTSTRWSVTFRGLTEHGRIKAGKSGREIVSGEKD